MTLVRGLLPTAKPSSTIAPTVRPTTPPWGTGTPWPSYSPAPGSTPTPKPSGSPGTPTQTPAPTIYNGDAFLLNTGVSPIVFEVQKSSSAAVEIFNDLASGPMTVEMRRHETENRYYCSLPKQYIERNITSPPTQWAAGDLVLMGNNELTVFLRTVSNSSNRPSTIIGKLDKSQVTSDKSVPQFMSTYFVDPTETVLISR